MKICSYDEAYDIVSAYEIGWCYKCGCDRNCPMKKKVNKEQHQYVDNTYIDEDVELANDISNDEYGGLI